jgi:hypothetical protein
MFFCFTCIYAIKCSASDGCIFQKLLLVSKADIIFAVSSSKCRMIITVSSSNTRWSYATRIFYSQ